MMNKNTYITAFVIPHLSFIIHHSSLGAS